MSIHYSEITGVEKTVICLIGELTPQALAFLGRIEQGCCPAAMIPCCFLGSGVLLKEGDQFLEGDLTW
jgi:hypothetical protein